MSSVFKPTIRAKLTLLLCLATLTLRLGCSSPKPASTRDEPPTPTPKSIQPPALASETAEPLPATPRRAEAPSTRPAPTRMVPPTPRPSDVPATVIATPLRTITCADGTTLEGMIACITAAMPAKDSGGFVVPNDGVLSEWRNVVAQMLNGSCDTIDLPSALEGIYSVTTFIDRNTGASYCVAMEDLDADGDGDVDRGWGTVVVNNEPLRELVIGSPHPIADISTQDQAIAVFKAIDARAFVLAGAHRHANSVPSTCQSSMELADAAHNAANMYFATVQEVISFYDARGAPFWLLEFHGMAETTCGGHVYLTHGVAHAPAVEDSIVQLKANLLRHHPGWIVGVPGDSPSCKFNATTNVSGRLMNGVSVENVCTVAASGYSGRFIHIEQDPGYRKANDWIQAIIDTWP
jgi:hypothetical protein